MSPTDDNAAVTRGRGLREPDVEPNAAADLVPAIPATVEDSGLDFGFLSDLALKTVYADTSCTTERAAERLALSLPVVDHLLQHLYREPRFARPSAPRIVATRCWIGAGSGCGASWT